MAIIVAVHGFVISAVNLFITTMELANVCEVSFFALIMDLE